MNSQAPFRNTSRTVATVTAIVGGVVLIGVGVSALLGTLGAFDRGSGESRQSADVSGITSLSIESHSSSFALRFGDVEEASLEIEGSNRYRWDMRVEDEELVVESKQRFWDFCIGWCGAGNERVTLTLPEELDDGSLDADFEVASGSIQAGGDFRDVYLRLAAGSIDFEGAARSIGAEVGAGRGTVLADGVEQADLDISAGRFDAEFTGRAPSDILLDVSAGRLELTLPNDSYDVRSDVSAGSVDNRLETSMRSDNKIAASVSAGSVLLQSR